MERVPHQGMGISLAMMVGILSSALSGAGYGTESGNMVDGAKSGADGQFYMAINVAAFREVSTFKAHVDRIARQYLSSRCADNVDRLYLPGGLENEIAERNRRDGIPLNAETVALIIDAGKGLGVDVAPLLESER